MKQFFGPLSTDEEMSGAPFPPTGSTEPGGECGHRSGAYDLETVGHPATATGVEDGFDATNDGRAADYRV